MEEPIETDGTVLRMATTEKVTELRERGVVLPDPASVFVGEEVACDRIASGTVIHPGCRISGPGTSIGPGCELGGEGPVTLRNCRLGAGVELAGGSFAGCVLWDGVTMGPNAHVRPGTILEEQATCGHAVGLKQTYLMPFVTLGSLINFCDCFMSGGTSRSDHSEVGSSFIHFNYTPHQDKATASLFGDVPRGVMLDQRPVFLGGQSGAVGPVRVAYGTVIAAGSIWRRDQLEPGKLVLDIPGRKRLERAFSPGEYSGLARIVANNLHYIGNIHAAYWWYTCVRNVLSDSLPHHRHCLEGGRAQLRAIIAERIRQLGKVVAKVEQLFRERQETNAVGGESRKRLVRLWPEMMPRLSLPEVPPCGEPPRALVDELSKVAPGTGYVQAIQGMSAESKQAGTRWLSDIVDVCVSLWDHTR